MYYSKTYDEDSQLTHYIIYNYRMMHVESPHERDESRKGKALSHARVRVERGGSATYVCTCRERW